MRSYIRFSAEPPAGKSIYDFINEIRRLRCGCSGQTVRNGVFYGNVSPSELVVIRDTAKDFDVKLTVVKRKGLCFKLNKYRGRYGLLGGMILLLCAVFYFSNTVSFIEINGCETISERTVMSALEKCGIERGSFIPDINFPQARREMSIYIDEIAYVGIRHTGCRVVVDIDERSYGGEVIDATLPCNIVAAHDAIITDISALTGQAQKKRGDTVKAGEIIISGVCTTKKGGTYLAHAMGTVIGSYYENVTLTLPRVEISRSESGRTERLSSLKLFSLNIPLHFGKTEFRDYLCDSSENPLSFFNLMLPLTVRHEDYREVVYSEVVKGDDELRAEIYLLKKRYETNFFPDSVILNEQVEEEITDNMVILKIKYEISGQIGRKNEILIKN